MAGLVLVSLVVTACTSSPTGGTDGRPVVVTAPMGCELSGCVGEGVETATGVYTVVAEDVIVPSGLFGFELVRSYRSDREDIGWFGQGWSTVYETTVETSESAVIVDAPAGFAPLWAPEAPEQWMVTGAPSMRSGRDAEVLLEWPSGEVWRFDVDGVLVSVTSPYGATVSVDRADGHLVGLTSSQGLDVVFEVNDDVVVSAAFSDGRRVDFEYSKQQLVSVSAPGLDVSYRYDEHGQIVEHATPGGLTVTSYDDGRVIEQLTATSERLVLSYDEASTTVRSSETLRYDHDDAGRLTSVFSGDDALLERRFDDVGRMVAVAEYVLPSRETVRVVERRFDDDRLVEETVNEMASTFEYDERGRLVQVTGSDPVEFDYAADAPLPIAVTTPQRGRDEFRYESGYIVEVIDATGAISRTTRDPLGNPVEHSPAGVDPWAYQFDPEGNVTVTTSPSGREWAATWGPRSLLLSETDPLGRRTAYEYDPAGRILTERSPDDATVRYSYDRLGRLVELVDADELVTSYQYGVGNNLTGLVVPGDKIWQTDTTGVDRGGTLVTIVAPDGTATATHLDTETRPIERRSLEVDGTTAEVTTYDYRYDQLTTLTTRRGTSELVTTVSYDDAGRTVATTESLDGRTVSATSLAYDNRRLARSTNGDETVEYSYDEAGRLIGVTADDEIRSASFDAGRLTSVRHDGTTTEIRYDADGRAVEFVNDDVTTSWTFDASDRPIQRAVGDDLARFEWSAADRLIGYQSTTAGHWGWEWDPVGRLIRADEPGGISTTYEYTDGAVTGINTAGPGHDRDDRFSYDDRGLLRRATTGDGEFNYTYDAAGTLSSVKNGSTEQWFHNAAGQIVNVEAGSDRFDLDYDDTGNIATVAGDEHSLRVTRSEQDRLERIDVSDRDPLTVEVDVEDRLSSIGWDADTHIDFNWVDTDSLEIQLRGDNPAQRFDLVDGALSGYRTDDVSYTASRHPNGLLDTVTITGDTTASISFDDNGRPVELTGDTAAATFVYDDQHRVSSLVTTNDEDEPKQTTVMYNADGRQVEGDARLIDALFSEDGSSRLPHPNQSPPPVVASADSIALHGAQPADRAELIAPPEPRPFEDITTTILTTTPQITAPIGVRNLPALAEQLAAAEIAQLAPTITIDGVITAVVGSLDPTGDLLGDADPFAQSRFPDGAVDALESIATGSPSLFDQVRNVLGGIVGGVVGGVVGVAQSVANFIVTNPLARLVLTVGTVAAALVACQPGGAACVPVALLAVGLLVGDGVASIATSVPGALRACPAGELAECGLRIADSALAVTQLALATGIGSALVRVALATRAVAGAVGPRLSLASGTLGTSRAELLATLRLERVAARERPVCVAQVCTRVDLVTRSIFGRYRFIEVKNGAAARLTNNQIAVYPAMARNGAYFPNGILQGGSPVTIRQVVQVQRY